MVVVFLALAVGTATLHGQAFTPDEQAALTAAVAKVAPSIVRIQTVGRLEQVEGERLGTAPATGLIVRADGLIVSSQYNFLGEPAGILVTLADGTRQAAAILARDRARELVLLRIATDRPLPVPEAVPRDAIRPGQWAVALGRGLGDDLPSVSTGIISAVDRIWGKALQTDANVSPVNYGGPLIDLRGRVYGVLVPLSPDATGALAGTEWYDSGIGFAVPLEDVTRRLDRLSAGDDLKPGLMGLALKGGDIYADPAEILAVSPKGPAAAAGVTAGGRIVVAEGQPIARQAQLKHILGRLDAGDDLHVTIETPEKSGRPSRRDVTFKLADEIPPYVAAWLGVLPRASSPEGRGDVGPGGLAVEYVFPDSPAARAGVQAGDRIGVDGAPIGSADELRTALLTKEPGATVKLTLRRDAPAPVAEVDATLAPLPTTTPDDLPPRHDSRVKPTDAAAAKPADRPAAPPAEGWTELRLPEVGHAADALVPGKLAERGRPSLLVWLGPKPKLDRTAAEAEWKSSADARNVVLVFPRVQEGEDWEPAQADAIRQTTEEAVRQFGADPARVGIGGVATGGALASWLALTERELYRGLATIDAPLPGRVKEAETMPGRPLLIRAVAAEPFRLFDSAEKAAKSLTERKFPVDWRSVPREADAAVKAQAEAILRLIDSLDRL